MPPYVLCFVTDAAKSAIEDEPRNKVLGLYHVDRYSCFQAKTAKMLPCLQFDTGVLFFDFFQLSQVLGNALFARILAST